MKKPFFLCICATIVVAAFYSQAAANTSQRLLPMPVMDTYRIHINDVLDISVWGVEGLSKTVTVRPDGKISFPLMGDILVRFEDRELQFVPGHPRQLLFGASEAVVLPRGTDGRVVGVEALEYHGDDFLDLVVATADGPDGVVSVLKNVLGGSVGTILRGDVDGLPGVTLSDGVFLLDHLFRRGAAPQCPVAADVDGDGSVNLGDAVTLLAYLFAGGPEPARHAPGVCAP